MTRHVSSQPTEVELQILAFSAGENAVGDDGKEIAQAW